MPSTKTIFGSTTTSVTPANANDEGLLLIIYGYTFYGQ